MERFKANTLFGGNSNSDENLCRTRERRGRASVCYVMDERDHTLIMRLCVKKYNQFTSSFRG